MSRNRPERLVAELDTLELADDLFAHRVGAWIGSLGDLLDTPRGLKFTLSAVVRAWQRIHGEVDLDELIILTALRYRAGPIYSFLIRRSLDLRLLTRESRMDMASDKEERERQLADLRSEWKTVLSGVDANHLAIGVLVSDLFPGAEVITGRKLWVHSNRLQSVASRRGDVYMDRIVSGDVPSDAIRDQTILRSLDNISRSERIDEFAERFVNSQPFAELTLFFDEALRHRGTSISVPVEARLITGSKLIEFASKAAADSLLYKFPTYHLIEGWIRPVSGDPMFDAWASGEILQRMPTELLRATELYFDLFRDSHVATEIQAKVRSQILEKAKAAFSQMSVGEFAACFPVNFPYTLSHLVRLDTKSPPELYTSFGDWRWMAPQLLAALREEPSIILPQVLALFGIFGPHPGPFESFKFNDEAVREFFGQDVGEFYRLVSRADPLALKVDENFQRLVPLARDDAQHRDRGDSS